MQPYETSDRFQNQLKRRLLYKQAARQPRQRPAVISQTHVIEVRQSIELLRQLIDQAVENTWLTLEGDLSRFSSIGLAGLVRDEAHKEETGDDLFAPLHSRVTIPLNQANAYQLKTSVLQHVGIRSHIVHLFLECEDRRLFAAHNKFRQCTLFGGWITADFLTQLQEDGVIVIQ
ncbi:MAG: hypothetical protein IPM39_14435 [Chloroflexi bacterium]|nr:hypothetical protein [Chloroflexota bacterium]